MAIEENKPKSWLDVILAKAKESMKDVDMAFLEVHKANNTLLAEIVEQLKLLRKELEQYARADQP